MLKHINDKELEELFALLGEVFHAHNIDYYLIGAIARDYWYKKGQLQSRISRDVDFAVLIPAKKEYEQVRTALQQKGFTETRQNIRIDRPLRYSIDLTFLACEIMIV